jgi:hypothetical protein
MRFGVIWNGRVLHLDQSQILAELKNIDQQTGPDDSIHLGVAKALL